MTHISFIDFLANLGLILFGVLAVGSTLLFLTKKPSQTQPTVNNNTIIRSIDTITNTSFVDFDTSLHIEKIMFILDKDTFLIEPKDLDKVFIFNLKREK